MELGQNSTSQAETQSGRNGPLPSIAVPKGGGAIRGIGEKFAANPVTGTGSLTIPIATSPDRAGLGPKLVLSYDSGASNGAFGLGWSVSLPSITRKTDKGLPRYADQDESDTFILSGGEDLVPILQPKQQGDWERVVSTRTVFGQGYRIHQYRPRVEGLFARIERWVNLQDDTDTFWRTISRDNITSWYGKSEESRVIDPGDRRRIFTWLLCEVYDDKGNAALYHYKPENSENVDRLQAHELNRSEQSRNAKRYPKRILYGNRLPYFPDLTAAEAMAQPSNWCFELVFDYGDHDPGTPNPRETRSWPCRQDPFSEYRATFEVRTYRLCRRILMFHHFPDERGVGLDCLVRSTDLEHSLHGEGSLVQAQYSILSSVRQTGYRRNEAGGYDSKSLPSLDFKYTAAEINEEMRDVDSDSDLPEGLNGPFHWVDLDGEGVPGVLSSQQSSWFYKPNLSPATCVPENGSQFSRVKFGPATLIAPQPYANQLSTGRQQLIDLSGNGHLDLAQFQGYSAGFFERTDKDNWKDFQTFQRLPSLVWSDPNLKFIDLTGDGLPDLLISEDDAFVWHPSLGTSGFGSAEVLPQFVDEQRGPKVVFSDPSESIFLADLSGDGLTDIVRIRNGEVCYWPNLGYGHFGPKVTMGNPPSFDNEGPFDPGRIHLADIDGSGTTDIIYFGPNGVDLYFNRSGNCWGKRRRLEQFPHVEGSSTATVIDLFGNGTACLVWSSALPADAPRVFRYIDLLGAKKPHLLTQVTNNLGAETRMQYVPSTKFYVADKLAGRPWVTRLPFPVHVVESVETIDYISRSRFFTKYVYHHGFYDGVEREFRGFGRVDQMDTEEFGSLDPNAKFAPTNSDAAFNVPPVLTKTWFHTGVFAGTSCISKQVEHEYYCEKQPAMFDEGKTGTQRMLPDSTLPGTVLLVDSRRISHYLTSDEMREACRAMRGSILRHEVYALDGTGAADRPYSVTESNYNVELLQPQGQNKHAVFLVHAKEAIDLQYDRKVFYVVEGRIVPHKTLGAVPVTDPRVTHRLILDINSYGNILRSITIEYGRRYLDSSLHSDDQEKQKATFGVLNETWFTNPVLEVDSYRTPLTAQTNSYELVEGVLGISGPESGHLFLLHEVVRKIRIASDGKHELRYEDRGRKGLPANQTYRRLLKSGRLLYRPNDLGERTDDNETLLSLGTLESLALPGESYHLAFTPGQIAEIYQRGGEPLLSDPMKTLLGVGPDGGGYIDLDGDGMLWTRTGRIFFSEQSKCSAEETADAKAHFYMPRRVLDPFGSSAFVSYDSNDLLPTTTRDPLSNQTIATYDYRLLQPQSVTDANGNRVVVSFDLLGLVAGTAVMGKPGEDVGDSLDDFESDLTSTQVDNFFSGVDPHNDAANLLGQATTRIVYDVERFRTSRLRAPQDPSQWQPTFSAAVVRETHASDLALGVEFQTQIKFIYSDGFGREIQNKVQAEPEPRTNDLLKSGPRWIGSGWTIYNNKGKPVRQYEPFFSKIEKGHHFEFGVQVGVSPILFYDPVGRVVAKLNPNHTFEKTVFEPWRQQGWDVNDTIVEIDPANDPDVGQYFQKLSQSEYLPSWYALRTDPTLVAAAEERWPDARIRKAETEAAVKASAHANTPLTTVFDSLGRAFLTIIDNAVAGKHETRVDSDIEGNQLSVIDALGRIVIKYDYNVLGKQVYRSSMEAGEHWILNDISDKPIRAWDSRGHSFRTEYDELRRPTALYVKGSDQTSDPRTVESEVLFQKVEYGENQPEALNLRTRVFRVSDSSGVTRSTGINCLTGREEGYDFKGNLLSTTRQFSVDHKALCDWSRGEVALMPEVFVSSTRYDAVSRPIVNTAPDGSISYPTYNRASLLESLRVRLGGDEAQLTFISDIDYDEHGRRVRTEYGNGSETRYRYDPVTSRLRQLTTERRDFARGQELVQDLSYVYDAVGNITRIEDDADIHNVVFFRNRRVDPSNAYTYDAVYRLIEATGREQLGLDGGGQRLAPTASSYNDIPRSGLTVLTGDGNAMGRYHERYRYDTVGNILEVRHHGPNPADPGWTRSYAYEASSLLEPLMFSNRLTSTVISGHRPFREPYTYDTHGNMTSMPQLRSMEWNFKDELLVTRRQVVSDADPDPDPDRVVHQGQQTYYVYDSAGQRARKVTESSAGIKIKERLYLGNVELYREYNYRGDVTLERKTLHVTDGKQQIAMIETRTQGEDPAPRQLIRYQYGNHLGSATLELDEAADIISYEEYCPYGNTSYQAGRSEVEVKLKRYRYTGMERDEESGLSYHSARYYMPWLGRWVSCDPAGLKAGINLYEYVSGCPVGHSDPAGLDEITIYHRTTQPSADKMVKGGPRADVSRAHVWAGEGFYGLDTPNIPGSGARGDVIVAQRIKADKITDITNMKGAGRGFADMLEDSPRGRSLRNEAYRQMHDVRETAGRTQGRKPSDPEVDAWFRDYIGTQLDRIAPNADVIKWRNPDDTYTYVVRKAAAFVEGGTSIAGNMEGGKFVPRATPSEAPVGEGKPTEGAVPEGAVAGVLTVVAILGMIPTVKQFFSQIAHDDYTGAAKTAGWTAASFYPPTMPVALAHAVAGEYDENREGINRRAAIFGEIFDMGYQIFGVHTPIGGVAASTWAVGESTVRVGVDLVVGAYDGAKSLFWGIGDMISPPLQSQPWRGAIFDACNNGGCPSQDIY